MAKLSSYTKDASITDKDKLAGSSFVGLVNGIPKYQTASYTIEDLGKYFSENITIGGQVYDIETIYNDLERTKTYTLGLQESFWSANEDGSLSTLSVAFANQVFSVTTSSKFATSLYVTNLGTSFGEFDVNGNLVSLAEAFANQVFTTTTSSKFATSIYVNELGSSVGTLNPDGSLASLSEAFANSVITTTTSDKFAESTRVNTLGATLGVYDAEGNTIINSNAGYLETVTTYVDAESATASKVGQLNSVLNILDENGVATVTSSQYLESITTHVDENSATASKVSNLGAAFGTFDGNTFSISEAKITEELNTYTGLNFSQSSYFQNIESNISGKPSVYRQNDEPAISAGPPQSPANGSIWYDTSDSNKVYILTSGVWTLTDDSRIGATASKVTNMSAAFGTFDVNNNFTIDGNASYGEAIVLKVDTDSATAAKIENLGAELGVFDENNNFATSFSADFKTAVNNEVDQNSSTAGYVSTLSAAVGIDKTDGSTLQATALVNGDNTGTTTTAIVSANVDGSKIIQLVDNASNELIEVGQYVTFESSTWIHAIDDTWRVAEYNDTTNTVVLDKEVSLGAGDTLVFKGRSVITIDGVSGNIINGFQIKGEGITVGTFVADYTAPNLTLSRAEILADDAILEFLGIYAAVTETANVLADIDGNLKASWGMQVDANGNIAGMKLLADNTGSAIIFNSDTFKIYNTADTTGVAPFEVKDGTVKIKSANIGDISFGDLKNIPDTFVITVVYADDASGTNQSLIKGSYNYYGIYQGQAALSSNDLPVSGVTFNQITGNAGINAKVVKLTPSKHVINYATDGTELDSITFTTEVQNITTSVTYRFDIIDNAGSVTIGTASIDSTFILDDAYEPAEGEKTTVKVYVFENDVQVATDSVTIYAVKDGSDAVTGFLTNASHTCSADNDGGNPVLTGSGGDFRVFVGGTDVSSSCVFSVVSYTSGLTIAIDSSSGAYTITGLTIDTANAVLKAIVPASVAGTIADVEIIQTYSISKSIKGDTGQLGPTGPTGLRVYTTNLFYQTIVTDSTAPTFDDSSLNYDFDTASWSGIPSGWGINPPSSSPGSGTNKLYYVSVNVVEGDPNTLLVGSPTTYFNFNGLVTFTGTGNNTLTDGSNNFNYTAIDGAWITTGAIKSQNFQYTDADTNSLFDENETVTGGTIINLVDGYLKTPSLWLKSDGSASFEGIITGSAGVFGDVTIDSNGISATNFSIDASGNVSVAGDITGSTGTFTGKLFAALGANSVINPDAYVAFGNVEVSNVGATITKNFPVLELSDDFRAIQARRAIYINTVLDDAQEFTGIRFFGTQLDANGDEDLLNKGMSIKADELKLQFFNDPGGTYVPSKLKWRDAQKVVGGTTYKTEIYAEYNSNNRPYIVIDGDVRFQGDVDLGTGQIVGHPIINAGTSTSNAAGTSTVIKNIDLDGNGHVLDTESISLTLDNITAAGNSTNNNIFVNNVVADAVIFDTANPETALPVGGLTWNPDESTLDLKLNENVTLQVGQEELLRVVNKTGATLNEADFKAVRIRSTAEGGAQGQRLAVLLAQANNDANSATTIGLVTETILDNEAGFITLSGKVNGINTTGAKSYLGLETWADGDILYLSPTQPGYLTNVKPQAPQHTIIVGWVVYAHANQGKIFVKVDNGYEIDELHNVRVNGVTAGDLLVYNDVDAVWENKKSIASLIMTGSLVGPTNFIIDPAVEGADSGTVEIKGGIDVNGDANFDGNVVIDGNLTVSGSTITIEATNLSVADNMIYLNAGSTVSNPDLGFAGNYNDGTYAHAGLFRDATDGRWKFFQGYTLEPDASSFIDTAHTSFALAPLEVTTLYGNVTGNVTGNLTGNVTGNVTGDITGNAATATNADKLDNKHAEEFTLAYVTSNNNSTTNSISVGNITSGSINASGAINGKIILNKTYSSVSTTAQAVVGLNAVTSQVAENALFELTVYGEGWYHKAVMTCYHDGTLGGDWSVYLSINEGDGVVIFSNTQTNGVVTINVLSTDALATPAVYVHVEYLGELNNLIQNPV